MLYGAVCIFVMYANVAKKCVVVSPKNHKVGWFLLFSWHTTLLRTTAATAARLEEAWFFGTTTKPTKLLPGGDVVERLATNA